MSDRKITEIIPDNMPDWFYKDMKEGQLFNRLIDRIESKWISVKDEIPKTDIGTSAYGTVDVIGWNGETVFRCEFREGNSVIRWSEFDDASVTHWQPLPEPPKDN